MEFLSLPYIQTEEHSQSSKSPTDDSHIAAGHQYQEPLYHGILLANSRIRPPVLNVDYRLAWRQFETDTRLVDSGRVAASVR